MGELDVDMDTEELLEKLDILVDTCQEVIPVLKARTDLGVLMQHVETQLVQVQDTVSKVIATIDETQARMDEEMAAQEEEEEEEQQPPPPEPKPQPKPQPKPEPKKPEPKPEPKKSEK